MKNVFYTFLSFGLITFGYLFSVNLSDDFVLGDSILKFIGLSAWQEKLIINNIEYDSGLHLTIFYGLGLIILGWLIANGTIKKEHPKVYKIIPLFLIIIVILTPSLIIDRFKTLVQ